MSLKLLYKQIAETYQESMRTRKILVVTKDSVKTGMELYLSGLPGPVTVRHITLTDAGVRLHTDVGSFEFGEGATYNVARPEN